MVAEVVVVVRVSLVSLAAEVVFVVLMLEVLFTEELDDDRDPTCVDDKDVPKPPFFSGGSR